MNQNIYKDIATRTGGDIYIGIVGPVRTGKSTFIKQFMNSLVIPNITEEFSRERANDELPQSSSGRTIMTTEPKFIPENAVKISMNDNSCFNVRLIDCVGYIVPSSLGYFENDQPRMVMTPWYEEPIPFNMAAEIGTRKVITEHSTIGLVVTTDGSISDIPREEYEEAEERVINELKEIKKPFAVVLNCMYPDSDECVALAHKLKDKYDVPVIATNCLELDERKIGSIISEVLYEFPIKEVAVKYPCWINSLHVDHWLRADITNSLKEFCKKLNLIKDVNIFENLTEKSSYVERSKILNIDFGTGKVLIELDVNRNMFYNIIKEISGLMIENDSQLMDSVIELSKIQKDYKKIKNALDEVEATGYGIVMPDREELRLEEPEIMKQGLRNLKL